MWITKATATQAAAATKRQQQQQLQFTIHFFVFFTFVGYISLILKVNVCVQAESESRLVDRHPNALTCTVGRMQLEMPTYREQNSFMCTFANNVVVVGVVRVVVACLLLLLSLIRRWMRLPKRNAHWANQPKNKLQLDPRCCWCC